MAGFWILVVRDQQDICLSREWVLFPPLRGEYSGGLSSMGICRTRLLEATQKCIKVVCLTASNDELLYVSVLVISPERVLLTGSRVVTA